MAPARRLALFAGEGLLALVSIGLCVTLLGIGEFLAREFAPSRSEPDGLMGWHQYSEVYGWAPRPGAVIRDGGQLVTINAAGYRGRLVGPRAPAGVKTLTGEKADATDGV